MTDKLDPALVSVEQIDREAAAKSAPNKAAQRNMQAAYLFAGFEHRFDVPPERAKELASNVDCRNDHMEDPSCPAIA